MIRLNKEISERAGVSKTVVKKLKTSDMVAQSKAAVNYIMSKIQTDDAGNTFGSGGSTAYDFDGGRSFVGV